MAGVANWVWAASELIEAEMTAQMRMTGGNPVDAVVRANVIAIGRSWKDRREVRWGRVEGDGIGVDWRDLQSLRVLRGVLAGNYGAARTEAWTAVVNRCMDAAEAIVAELPWEA